MKQPTKFKLNLIMACTALALTGLAQMASAEEGAEPEYTFLDSIKEGKPMTSFRLRYENVEESFNSIEEAKNRGQEMFEQMIMKEYVE